MKYVLDMEKLNAGDIILVRTHDDTCQKIRRMSGSDYSHALIYKGDKSCLEAHAFGVNSVNPQRLSFQNSDDAAVFRLKEDIKKSSLYAGFNSAIKKVGMSYSVPEAYRAARNINHAAIEPNKQFCTRFVAQIYSDSGVDICQNADYCSTFEIEQSTELLRIDNILKEGSEEELLLTKEKNHVIDKQTGATYEFLIQVRSITNVDIESLDAVDAFLTENPGYDNDINEALIASGYLDLGDIEASENPYFYNYTLFIKKFGEQQALDISVSEVANETNRGVNFKHAVKFYSELYDTTKLKYFQSLAKCYAKQLELSEKRLAVFQSCIAELHPFH